jgi:hypothetical protein
MGVLLLDLARRSGLFIVMMFRDGSMGPEAFILAPTSAYDFLQSQWRLGEFASRMDPGRLRFLGREP